MQHNKTSTGSVILVAVAALFLAASAQAKIDNWDVEGADGVLHVRGALTESACRLDMASSHQEIDLGTVSTGKLQRTGNRAAPTVIPIRLFDCLHTRGSGRDERTGNLLWAPNQPVLSVTFLAPADADNPQLVKVRGASGIGLRLLDNAQREIRLGHRGAPLFIAPGDDVLTWYVMPERTSAPLNPGAYRAVVDFRLSYD